MFRLAPGQQAPEKKSWTASWFSLPRMWMFLGYLFPRTSRERKFRPAFEDLHQDYVIDLLEFDRTATARRLSQPVVVLTKLWMNMAFACWVAKLVADVSLLEFHKRE